MKRIQTLFVIACGLLFAASTCFAQMYTVTDLGALGNSWSEATGINASGQVVGNSVLAEWPNSHAFRTAPKRPIRRAKDDVGATYCTSVLFAYCLGALRATGINNSGQVVGDLFDSHASDRLAYRTAPNSAVAVKDRMGTNDSFARAINKSGQVIVSHGGFESFRTAPYVLGGDFHSFGDNLGSLAPGGAGNGNGNTEGYGINDLGQAVGASDMGTGGPFVLTFHGFRTGPNSPINPQTDDLGTLGGSFSYAYGINVFGQVIGWAGTSGDTGSHAFRTAPNSPINPVTDDLGTLGGNYSVATAIDNYGQVVGWSTLSGDTAQHAFLYSGGVMRDLNDLVPSGSGCAIVGTETGGHSPISIAINDAGQIAANRNCIGQQHAVLLNPVYKALVRSPINANGSSVFSATRQLIPARFILKQYGLQTCSLPPATITVTRATDGTLSPIDEFNGQNFQIDPTACQYVYNLPASRLGIGTYRVDISIEGIFVGHAVFALK